MTPNPREQAGSLNAQASGHDLPLEATELRSSDSLQDDTTLPSAPAVTPSAYKTFQNLLQPVKKFWERQISVVVAHEGSRDHLALERTYLGYLRTSLALAILGISIAQLFRLQSEEPNRVTEFDIGISLACICIGAALVTAMLGGYRFWRQQNCIIRGKVQVGGWEINTIVVICLIITLCMFLMIVTVANGNDE